jgi:acylphosphatase
MSQSLVERRQVYYSGYVQGVGFRYTAHRIARRYQITGFVRNLPDRRVQVVVEGPRGEIGGFLDELARAMSGYIQDVVVDKAPSTGEYSGFEIRF